MKRFSSLFLGVLIGIASIPEASFSEDHDIQNEVDVEVTSGEWTTVVLYMVDPVNHEDPVEIDALREASPYIRVSEETFAQAESAQNSSIAEENEQRINAARELLQSDLGVAGEGREFWFPRWIPLARAETTEDSLFANILDIQGDDQSLREFLEAGGTEPDGDRCQAPAKPAISQCLSPEHSNFFAELASMHDEGIRVISLSFAARWNVTEGTDTDHSFAEELSGEADPSEVDEVEIPDEVEFDWNSVRLLKPATVEEASNSIAPLPAGKSVSTQSVSWGELKSSF